MPVLNNDTHVSVLVDGLDHPEGVAWGLDGYAYAGSEAGQVFRIDIESHSLKQVAQINPPAFLGGLALDSNHNIYVCDAGNSKVHKVTKGGIITTYSEGAPSEPFRTPNYPTFDRAGNLYVSDSGGWKANDGCIYKIAPGGDTIVWERSLKTFPNGLCMGPKQDYLYVVMSLSPPRVDRVKIWSDGSPGLVETVVELPGTVPDGLAFDTDGHLYISCYRPDRIYRLSPDGQLQVLAQDYEGPLIAAPLT